MDRRTDGTPDNGVMRIREAARIPANLTRLVRKTH